MVNKLHLTKESLNTVHEAISEHRRTYAKMRAVRPIAKLPERRKNDRRQNAAGDRRQGDRRSVIDLGV